jgi:hypothetical protein
MKIVVFGLTISSSWGNGHATLWRGLTRALMAMGHSVVFFERDVPYYAMNRDLWDIPGGELVLYEEWHAVSARALKAVADSDAAIVTSYCPDGIAATDLVLSSARGVTVTFCFTPAHRGIAPHHTSAPQVKEEFAEFCAKMVSRYAPASEPADALITPLLRRGSNYAGLPPL